MSRFQGLGIAPSGVAATMPGGPAQTVGPSSVDLNTTSIPTNATQLLKAYVLAVEGSPATAVFEISQAFQNLNGVVTAQGNVTPVLSYLNAILAGAGVAFVIVGTNVVLRATGPTLGNRTVNWQSRFNVMLSLQS